MNKKSEAVTPAKNEMSPESQLSNYLWPNTLKHTINSPTTPIKKESKFNKLDENDE